MKNARVALGTNLVACVAALAVAGCSGGGTTNGAGGQSGSGGGVGTAGGTGGTAGKSSGTGGTNPGSGGTGGGTGGTVSGTGGTVAGTGGTPPGTGGSQPGSGGMTSGSGGTPPGSGGSQPGSGGATSGSGGRPGTGGAAMGGMSSGGMSPAGGTAGASVGGAGSGGSAGAAPVSCPTTSTLKAGDNNESIMSGGESRTFIVHVPSSYSATTPAPVILDFHPLGGSGSQQESSSGWKAKCDSVGCIAIYPDSSKSKAGDNSWNAGYCCDNAEKNQVDDVGFAKDIIKWIEANACVDPKRIYASGGSNGGGMTYRMACDAADVIAAVAPVDFRCVTGKDPLATMVTASNNTACTCTLPRPITVVAWDEGADTSIVPYGGGQTPQLATDCPPNGSCVGIGFSSAVVNRDTWAKFDMCTGSAAADPDNSLCQQYTTCEDSTSVTLCTTTSGGHLAVYGNSGAKFTDTAWNILKTQSLP